MINVKYIMWAIDWSFLCRLDIQNGKCLLILKNKIFINFLKQVIHVQVHNSKGTKRYMVMSFLPTLVLNKLLPVLIYLFLVQVSCVYTSHGCVCVVCIIFYINIKVSILYTVFYNLVFKTSLIENNSYTIQFIQYTF